MKILLKMANYVYSSQNLRLAEENQTKQYRSKNSK